MGRPLGSKNKNIVSIKDRLINKIISRENGCWIMKVHAGHRYPSLQVNGKNSRANRISFEVHNNCTIPKNIHCLHTCDNTKCINPDHLFLGTHKENMTDMIKKGRDKKDGPKGIRCARHILKENQVIEIINRLCKGESQTRLAEEFNVSQTAIWHIKANTTWKHIPRGFLNE